jgi:hypothetical protein
VAVLVAVISAVAVVVAAVREGIGNLIPLANKQLAVNWVI